MPRKRDDRKLIDDPDLPLSEVLALWPEVTSVFIRHKMLCVGCMIRPFHTIIDACSEYGLDEQNFREELRRSIN